MIPANALRIGNYVEVEGRPIPILNGQEIDYGHAVQFPIPLTPEILESCGFKKIESPQLFGWYSSVFGNLKLCWCHGDDVTLDDKEGDEIAAFPCKHLHQLQNLYFALTGKELTVTL